MMDPEFGNLYHWMQNILLDNLHRENFVVTITEQFLSKITWGGFLIRRSSAIRRFFTGFLRCDSRIIMKSFHKKFAREFSGNFGRFLYKFPVNSRSIF